MADGLYVRRLYIDSRFRSTGTTDDFEMQLQEGVELPAGCHCYLSEWTGSVSWETVSASNQTMYLTDSASWISFRAIQLPTGPHDSESMRVSLQDVVNIGRPAGIGSYVVSRTSSTGSSSTASLGSAAFRHYTISVSSGSFCVIPGALLEKPGLVHLGVAGGRRC